MGDLEDMEKEPFVPPRQTDTSTPSPPPAPEETEPLAAAASREEERRGERREEPRKVQPPVKQTCDRCWQTPETWRESPCEYNDRVRVTCGVCGKFIG